jgi:hypothetical protein
MFDNSKVSDVSVIKPAERVEGCELIKVTRDKDPQSKSYRSVSFTFLQKSTGAQITHKEFAPNRKIGDKVLDDEAFKKNISLGHSRVAHISRAFLSQETFEKIKIADLGLNQIDKMWDDYIAMTGQALQIQADGTVGAAKGVECALKVVYKGKYSALPAVPPFISTANHPKEFTTNTQYDKYQMDTIVPDKEQPTLQNQGGGFAAAPPQGDFGAPAATHPSGF